MQPQSPRRQASIVQSPALRTFDKTVQGLLSKLAANPDHHRRAHDAAALIEACRVAQEQFGAERTAAFDALRDDGWSLGDLAAEFGMTRSRVAQIACRDRYKQGVSRGGGGRAKP
jgi:hypothetical protein